MRYVYILDVSPNTLSIITPERFLSEDYYYDTDDNCIVDSFEMTANMDDLNILSKENFHNRIAPDILKDINEVIDKLEKQGYHIGIPDDDNPGWMWGQCEKRLPNGRSINLDDSTRTEILMWWLDDIRDIIKKYDHNYLLLVY